MLHKAQTSDHVAYHSGYNDMYVVFMICSLLRCLGHLATNATSLMLQMLISVQSLIFVDEPYFNEPGFENTMHTPEGDQASKAYNQNIRYTSVCAAQLVQADVQHFDQACNVKQFMWGSHTVLRWCALLWATL